MKTPDGLLNDALGFERVLYAYLFRYARNSKDANSLLEETYARLLHTEPPALGSGQSKRAVCLAMARDVALEWLRSHHRVVSIALLADLRALEAGGPDQHVEEIIAAQNEIENLSDAVGRLPTECRRVYTLRKVYAFSATAISERLNISEDVVEKHLSDAARRCAATLLRGSSECMEDVGWFARIRELWHKAPNPATALDSDR